MLSRTLYFARTARRGRFQPAKPKFRYFATEASAGSGGWKKLLIGAGVIGAIGLVDGVYTGYFGDYWPFTLLKQNKSVDYDAVRKDIATILESNPKYDDGSYGPVLVRLAWHAAGTYDVNTKTGGSNGATMRFLPESGHGANAGLDVARNLLDPIHKKYPQLPIADLWILAGNVAIEEMGGPRIEFRGGRTDKPDGSHCPPDGRLPDASKGPSHVKEIFHRQGFNDQEIVALLGAHSLGRCHTNRSGYEGPWTNAPTTFSNDFYVQLLERKWTKKKWNGPEQYEDETGTLMMLPADLALLQDPEFKKWVQIYAKDEDRFFKDFAKAWQKLVENGVQFK